MHPVYRALLLIAFISAVIFPQGLMNVTILVTADSVGENENVYIAGNDEQLGGWDASKVPLEKKSSNHFQKTFSFTKGTKLEFKFTKGSWATEALFQKGVVRGNLKFTVTGDTTLGYVIPFWNNASERKPRGQITGTVKYHRNIQSEGLRTRDLIVWLPPGYDTNTNQRYPVLYMHDGQNIIDPATSSFGADWEVDERADSLIRCKAIEPMIIVGINNTLHRSAEYSNSDTGKNYMKLLVNVIKPMIDTTYRTKPGREFTATAGSSMGGLISFMLAWEYPGVFSKAACFSPAFLIDRFDYVTTVRETKEKKDIFLYIDNGGVGLENLLQPGVDSMLAVLKAKGYKEGENFVFVKDPLAEHTESAWARRIANPLLLFYGSKK